MARSVMLEDLHLLLAQALTARDRGRLDDALAALLSAATETHVAEADYASVLHPLADVFARLGHLRPALTVWWYLSAHDPEAWKRAAPLLPAVPPVDRARSHAALGRLVDAAREMEDAGRIAAAAIYREQASDWPGARALWSRLGQNVLSGTMAKDAAAYDAALVQCNLARCAERCGDARHAHDSRVLAVRLLEEAADHFETVGLRERAFDCFQALIQLGREHASFEDMLEGFANCIRILREDHLKDFALHHMDEAIAAATEQNELSAAATIAFEAGQYVRSFGDESSAAHYLAVQADLWRAAAAQHVALGDPPEIAENALLAAVVAFSEIGRFTRVGALYRELQGLDLPDATRARYAKAASRYEHVTDDTAQVSAARSPRHDAHSPNVWHVDLLEWEQAGSAVECCADVILGRTWPDRIRREALLARLTALVVEAGTEVATPDFVGKQVELANHLGQMQLYVVLAPLERLWRSPERAVRLAVLSALQRLFYKRSFVTLERGLVDPDPLVAHHAATALEALYFPHAFDPLARVLRQATSPEVRASAIKALSKIDTKEAAELLFGILAHGSPKDRLAATRCLREPGGAAFVTLAKEELATSSPAMQTVLRDLLTARGG